MKHLTIDEMLDFVSLTEMNDESIRISAAVNGHIRKCKKCLQMVTALQMLYDEFSRLNISGDFRAYLSEEHAPWKERYKISVKAVASLDEPDTLRR